MPRFGDTRSHGSIFYVIEKEIFSFQIGECESLYGGPYSKIDYLPHSAAPLVTLAKQQGKVTCKAGQDIFLVIWNILVLIQKIILTWYKSVRSYL